jgi:hypothetical protein
MDNSLFDLIDEQMPKFTPEIAEGYAVSQMANNEEYIDRLFRQIAHNFPPNIQYHSPPRRLSPLEEFNIVKASRRGGTRNIYDVAKSNVYMMAYRFSVDGIDVIHNMYMLYVEQGGITTIKNAKFGISPVIADVALSVRGDSIFIIMNRAKLTFKKFTGSINVDGDRETTYVVWSQVYNVKSRNNMFSTMGHYLFAKFGVMETFKRIGVDIQAIPISELSSEKYPVSKWVTVTSAGRKFGARSAFVSRSDVALLIPRHQYNHVAKTLAATFFYVADIFPDRVTIADLNSTNLWRILLGKLIFQPGDSDGKILNQINTHISSVDGYVDGLVQEWLADGGYPGIETIYDLFFLLIDIFPTAVANTSDTISSLIGKRLVVNRYVNEDIINGISNVLFAIQKQMNAKGEVKPKDLQTFLTRNLKYNQILRVNSGHSEVKSVSSASDCLLHKITSITLLQTETTSNTNGSASFDDSKVADASILTHGAAMNLPSKDPTGRSRLPGCARIDASGTFILDPAHKEIIEEVQRKIKR